VLSNIKWSSKQDKHCESEFIQVLHFVVSHLVQIAGLMGLSLTTSRK